MWYKIIFKKRFAQNLLNVLTFLEQELSKTVADEFQDKLNFSLTVLREHPYVGAPSKKINTRGLLITKHNRLFYRIHDDTIIILSLADTRRKKYTH